MIEDCARRIVLLKLTTDRHEASRCLSVTAGLLVWQVVYAGRRSWWQTAASDHPGCIMILWRVLRLEWITMPGSLSWFAIATRCVCGRIFYCWKLNKNIPTTRAIFECRSFTVGSEFSVGIDIRTYTVAILLEAYTRAVDVAAPAVRSRRLLVFKQTTNDCSENTHQQPVATAADNMFRDAAGYGSDGDTAAGQRCLR